MNNALDAIKSMLPKLGEQTAKVHEVLVDFQAQEDVLVSERDELLRQPLAAEDLIRLMEADIDAEADAYRARAAAVLRRQIADFSGSHSLPVPKLNILAAQKRKTTFTPRVSSMLGGFRELSEIGSHVVDHAMSPLNQGAATFLFRAEMKRAVAEIVVAMDYPFPGAQAREVVEERVAAIAAELAALRTTRAELETQARALGISLPDRPQRVPQTAPAEQPDFDAEAHPFTYRRKSSGDRTPTHGADIEQISKHTGAVAYVREDELPGHIRALIP